MWKEWSMKSKAKLIGVRPWRPHSADPFRKLDSPANAGGADNVAPYPVPLTPNDFSENGGPLNAHGPPASLVQVTLPPWATRETVRGRLRVAMQLVQRGNH